MPSGVPGWTKTATVGPISPAATRLSSTAAARTLPSRA
jgi:hypothetical protein